MKSNGFSLIELMVVIAIVAILAAVAIPTYKDYTIKAKIQEAIVVLENYKVKVIDTFNRTGAFPVNALGAAVITTLNTSYVTQVQYYRTVTEPNSIWILATLNATAVGIPSGSNQIIMLVGYDKASNSVRSHCGQWAASGYVDTKYLPNGCNGTNIAALQDYYTNQ